MCQRRRAGKDLAKLLHGFQSGFIIHTRKGFPLIEHFAVAIELAMIVWLELRIARQLARQQSASQRHTDDDSHVSPFGFRKEQFRRSMAKHVENDLHALHAGKFDGLERFFDFLDADAVVTNFAGRLQSVQHAKHFGSIENVGGRAM